MGDSTPNLQYAVPTVGAPTFHSAGYKGSGIKIGIIDEGINSVDYITVAGSNNCTGQVNGSHGTIVAAVVAQNKTGSPSGVAYEASIYDAHAAATYAGWYQTWVDSCASWLSTNGVHIAVTSWRYSDVAAQNSYDWYADRYAMLHTVSFGNVDNLTPGAPANSFNTLSVSATDDKNTASPSDDTFASDVSLQGPLSDGRKKPELSAPGKDIVSLASPGGANGTSFAAPAVAGIAGLAMQRMMALGVTDNLQLRTRALLINSATAKRSSKDPTYGWWDPQWGWGYVNGTQAYQDASSSTPKTYVGSVGQGGTTKLYFTANAGMNNVTLVWKKRMADDKSTGYLSNLDLKVYNDATGTLIDSSSSSTDTVEYVRFNAPATGTYRIEVVGTSLSNTTSQYFVLAASQPIRTAP